MSAGRDGDAALSTIIADQPWEGRLAFDQPRHRRVIHLPLDCPRINQFPEWFTVEADARYEVRLNRSRLVEQSGAQLVEGFPVKLNAGETVVLEVRKR